jgi:hypothetical protein
MKPLNYILFLAAMDVVPSVVLWGVSPTDSVRVWYPTLLSYVGEHLAASAAALWGVYGLFRIIRLRLPLSDCKGGSSFSGICVCLLGLFYLAVDFLASLVLALTHSADGGSLRLWHTQTLVGYLSVREPVFIISAVILLGGVTLRHRARRVAAS